jgi:hypothetical protein
MDIFLLLVRDEKAPTTFLPDFRQPLQPCYTERGHKLRFFVFEKLSSSNRQERKVRQEKL